MMSSRNRSPSPRPTLKRTQGGCLPCRRRHVKCIYTENTVQCTNCEKAKLRCTRDEAYRFRILSSLDRGSNTQARDYEFLFSSEQQWVRIPEISFVEEKGSPLDNSSSTPTLSHRRYDEDEIDTDIPSTPDDTAESEYFRPPSDSPAIRTPSLSLWPPPCGPKVSSAEEAMLFRHFFDTLGPWFDLYDEQKTFTREVMRRAATNIIIFNSVLAIASRQCANLGLIHSEKAEAYHNDCFNALLSILNSGPDIADDDLFAAMIMLRTKEEFDSVYCGPDHQVQLLGIEKFTNSDLFDVYPSKFRERTYWVALRQEINSSLLNHSSLEINLDVSFVKRAYNLSDAFDWANCCIFTLAKIVTFCFGGHHRTQENYQVVHGMIQELYHMLPRSLHPVYVLPESESSNSRFPQMWFHDDSAVVVFGYHLISKILLTSFNPTVLRIGLGSNREIQKTERNVADLLSSLCGMSLSHSDFGPAMCLSCFGISLVGDRLVNEEDHKLLLDMLQRTEIVHGWPTKRIRNALQESRLENIASSQ